MGKKQSPTDILRLAPIMEETYGIAIYQEQVMFAAMELGGYTAAEADDLRKAISKKKADAIAKHREKFIRGAVGKEYTLNRQQKKFSKIGKTSPGTDLINLTRRIMA